MGSEKSGRETISADRFVEAADHVYKPTSPSAPAENLNGHPTKPFQLSGLERRKVTLRSKFGHQIEFATSSKDDKDIIPDISQQPMHQRYNKRKNGESTAINFVV